MNMVARGVLPLLFVLAGGITRGQSINQITTVSPTSAVQGAGSFMVTFSLDTDAPPAPPADVLPTSVKIGNISGTSLAHPSQYSVTALFTIPGDEAAGAKGVAIAFPNPAPVFTNPAGFTVTAMPSTPPSITADPQSRTARPGAGVIFTVTASGSAPLAYQWRKDETNITGAAAASYTLASVSPGDGGGYRCVVTNVFGATTSAVAVLTVSTNSASEAGDSAADVAYDAGWTNGANGGSGFGAWQLAVGGQGGFFTASSGGNAGGSSNIDAAGRAWGLWSTNGVTEAVRALTGGALNTDQVIRVRFDNGYIAPGRSVGLALQNAVGSNVWALYFSGGSSLYTVQDGAGSRSCAVPYTGDGLAIEVQPGGGGSYLAIVTDAAGTRYPLAGLLVAQADPDIARVRVWNWEAGAGSDSDLYLNDLSVRRAVLRDSVPVLQFPLVDTAQVQCYGDATSMAAPAVGQSFFGQDAQYAGRAPSYTLSGDGLSVLDNRTGLTWQRTPDLTGEGQLTAADKLSYSNALLRPDSLNASHHGGYSDWRLPTIKELYSLFLLSGTDPSGYTGTDTSVLKPFIDTNYFRFAYGDTNAGERIIDSQYATRSLYVSPAVDPEMFGVNFADGRIKGYGLTVNGSAKTFFVQCVRGNPSYGLNLLVDNGDGTVTDLATGLTWQKADSGAGMTWSNALAYAESLSLGGYQDWRLPDVKELQSIVDYARSPDSTASAALDPVFVSTAITNEAGVADFPWYWSGSTHAAYNGSGQSGDYVCFGRALGYMNGNWIDIHGAGCQRSDPKGSSLAGYTYVSYGYYNAIAPQGDAIRIFNRVRCVRGGTSAPTNDADADGLSDWYEYNYATNATALAASGDLDGDGVSNLSESGAGTSPLDAGSFLGIASVEASGPSGALLTWRGVAGKTYRIHRSTNLVDDAFATIVATNVSATAPLNTGTDVVAAAGAVFYRIAAE